MQPEEQFEKPLEIRGRREKVVGKESHTLLWYREPDSSSNGEREEEPVAYRIA